MTRHTFISLLGLVALTTVAEAHPGHVAGFLHPFTGIDHIVTMVAVGLLAGRLGGRAVWAVPLTFVAMMVAGALLAFYGLKLVLVEEGILLSVVALSTAVIFARRLPMAVALSLAGAFAVFHGYAHGAEIPAGAGGFAYGIGFIAATSMLHAIGIGLARLAGARRASALAA
jgi:urease accessory protein